MSVRALGRTRRAEFLPRTIDALDHASLDVRREAAFAVAHIGSGDPATYLTALAALRARLRREHDAFVSASLAESIGRLPFPNAPSLEQVAGEFRDAWARLGAGPARAVLSVGVGRGAEAMARRGRILSVTGSDTPALVGLLNAVLDQHARSTADGTSSQDVLDRRVRRLATSALVTLRALTPARRAAAALDVDAQVRRLAVLDLAYRPEVSATDATPAFSDESMLVRQAAVARLGSRLPALAERATTDAHVAVRLAALDALGEAQVCRTVCLLKLREPHTSDTWHQAAHALVALARTDADAARPHVARAATSDVWQVRMYAARAAGETRQEDVLARLAADANPNVQTAALLAWRQAKLPNLTGAAVAALGSDDGQLVLEAVAALGTGAGERVSGTGRADIVSALRAALSRITALRRETSRDPRVALIERIDEMDPDRAATLRPYLTDFDPFVGDRVAALLNARGTGSVALQRGDGRLGQPALPTKKVSLTRVPTAAEVETLGRTTVTLRLSGGRAVTLRLYAAQAPTAVARFVAQVAAGEWNGRTFHRVEPGFVVQGGSPAANEYAGAAAFARDEFSSLSHVRGTIGISTRGADTGDGQIFINLVDNVRLDFAFTIIASITGDASLIDDIVEGEVIESATVSGMAAGQ